MKFEISVEEHYPHPVRAVWKGLTSQEALSRWLLETHDFVPQVGCRFKMVCVHDDGRRDVYRCVVLDLDPPRRMLWSWVLEGEEDPDVMHVEFRLSATDNGAKLTVCHRSDRGRDMLDLFKAGWPGKLERLDDVLNAPHPKSVITGKSDGRE